MKTCSITLDIIQITPSTTFYRNKLNVAIVYGLGLITLNFLVCMMTEILLIGCFLRHTNYRKSPDRSRVPDKRRVPDTGRGSRQIVLIEAGGFYPGIYGNLLCFNVSSLNVCCFDCILSISLLLN